MPRFIYTAKNFEGETKGGEVVAKEERIAVQQLRAEGFLVTSMKAIDEDGADKVSISFFDRFKTVPLKEKMVFARNLSIMIISGITISKAVKNLSEQVKSKRFKEILKSVYEDIQGGKSLSDSLAKFPAVFSNLFVNMVKVGEASGSLDEVLNILATQLEKEHDLRSKVKGALIYPAVIIFAMIGIGILMLTYILPKITGVFKDMDVDLPPATQFIIALSDFMKDHSILVMIALVALVVFSKFFFQTEKGKKILSWALINIPAIKNIVIKVNCARFSRIYSSLLRSGVSVIEALNIVSDTLTNYYYRRAIKDGVEQVQKGVDLSKFIAKNKNIFPVLVSQMMEVGEETGKTDVMLLKLAEFYEAEVDQITKNLSSIIEPVLMIFIGVAVGFFAISMLQPMYSLMENIN